MLFVLVLLSSFTLADGETLKSDTGDVSVNGTITTEGLLLASAGYTGDNIYIYNSSAKYDGERGIYSTGAGAIASIKVTTGFYPIEEGTMIFRLKLTGARGAGDQLWICPSSDGTCGTSQGIGFGVYTDATYFSGYDYKADSAFVTTQAYDTNWHKFLIHWNSTSVDIYEGNFTNNIFSRGGDYSSYITTYNIQTESMDYPFYLDNIYVCNGTIDCSAPSLDTTLPTITVITPTNGTISNIKSDFAWINISLNENGSVYLNNSDWVLSWNNITDYYFYNTNYNLLADGVHTINITANDSSQNNVTQLLYFTIDVTTPIIVSNLEGNNTYVKDSDNLTYHLNCSDNNLVWSLNVTIDGNAVYNISGIDNPTFFYNGTYNVSGLSAGEHNLTALVCDAHTDYDIGYFEVKKDKDKISFDNVWVGSESATKDIYYSKQEDRYNFTFEYAEPRDTIILELPLTCDYIQNPKYKGWFVCPDSPMKWVDFEGDYDIDVKIKDDRYKITVKADKPTTRFEFDSVGALNCVNYTYKFYKYSVSTSYNSQIIELTSQTYKMIVSHTGITGVNYSSTFHLNNTEYTTTKTSSSTQTNFTTTIMIPTDWISNTILNVSKELWWNYTINSVAYNTSTQNQTIYRIFINNCTLYPKTYTLNISFINNSDDTAVSVNFESAFDVWYNDITYYRNYSFESDGINYYSLCIYPSWVNYSTTANMEYTAGGNLYNYNINNYTLSNITKTLSLYTSDGTTTVTFTVIDQDDQVLENVLIYVMPYDTGTNSYNTVEILSTDYQGVALGNIILNTQPYKFILYYQGVLVFESSNTFITSTARTFRVNLQTDYYDSVDVAYGIVSTLTFTNATRNFVYTFSDGTGTIHHGCLRVVKRSINGDTVLNDTCVASAASSIITNIGDNVGSNIYIATGYVKFDYEIITNVFTITEADTWKTYGTEGLFASFLITTALVTIGIFSPPISIALLIISFVITNTIGLFHLNWMWLSGFIILGCIAIFRMSRSGAG